MRGELIVILCAEDHTISIMLIAGDSSLQFYRRSIFEGDIAEGIQITYSDLTLVRHANNAYQIYLQTDSDVDGRTLETFEVFTTTKVNEDGDEKVRIKVFQESSILDKNAKKFKISSAQKDQYLTTRTEGTKQIKALRVCNYAEKYFKKTNSCSPCIGSAGEYAFPVEINAEKCHNCEGVQKGVQEIEDKKHEDRFNYLCKNAEALKRPGRSEQVSKNFFDIGTDIPESGFTATIEIAGITAA